jgi:hypothetical protein
MSADPNDAAAQDTPKEMAAEGDRMEQRLEELDQHIDEAKKKRPEATQAPVDPQTAEPLKDADDQDRGGGTEGDPVDATEDVP